MLVIPDSLNALAPIEVMPSGIYTTLRFAQPANAYVPIAVMLPSSGITRYAPLSN